MQSYVGKYGVLAWAPFIALLGLSVPQSALADWKASYKELTLAAIPAENASSIIERFTPFAKYLTRMLGVPVKLRVASDYAAVIEGQRAGHIHMALYSPASYARAYVNGVQTQPFAIQVNDNGALGYYSVLYVRADSPYQNIEDLKGKNLGLVDPNSTSGNNVPRFALAKLNINPDSFFGRVIYTGSHENAVIALAQGTIDVAANWWSTDAESNLTRMQRKGMEVGGKPLRYEDFRIVFKSDLIVNGPITYLTTLPADLKSAIETAFFSVAENDKAAFDKIYDGRNYQWKPTDHAPYKPVVELIQFVDRLRKKRRRR